MTEQSSLRHKLTLFKYLLNCFKASDISPLQDALKREREDYDSDGNSYFFNALKGMSKINEDILETYDQNIKLYLEYINKQRIVKIQLKYFQYISILFTEIFLDNYFNNNDTFFKELNDFVKKENSGKDQPFFLKNDLSKLAFWMATGSGKTLIMHINFLQFHKYNKKKIDNTLLITPNEGLSRQHLEELRKSNINAKIFNEMNIEKNIMQIIEIHKLTDEKKGEGVTVEVSSFEGNNLIFVDEGHKGFSGTTWKGIRDKISEIGFTFEYSATFDEAISFRNDELMDEYSKAIIMDYSYSHFYYDGFGKEFFILNLKNIEHEKHKEFVLLTNLLSYYQQLKFFEKNNQMLQDFSFAKPLWIFVGNSVSSQKKDKFDKNTLSDIQFVVTFLNKFLLKEIDFIKRIDNIMNDKILLKKKDEIIQISQLLQPIKNDKLTAKEIYQDILKLVFNSESGGKLELFHIVNSSGEVGLKVSNSSKYFSLVYIGDVASFKKKLEEKTNLIFHDDKFSDSYFATINNKDSPIHILIGSKKFIEGWNSFRVSTMGLLNMGRSKGSQIIQLFGRGVRIRGYQNLMKRSRILVNEQILEKQDLKIDPSILETLNIFGIKADYIDTFRKQLEEEEILEEEILNLNIKKNLNFLKKKLVILKQKGDEDFSDLINLEYDSLIPTIKLDMRPKFEMFESGETGFNKSQFEEKIIPVYDYLDYFDWDDIYFKLYNVKQQKKFHNLHFNKKILIEIMKKNNYKVVFDKTFEINTFSQFVFIEKLCIRILQKYIIEFYNIHKRKWVTNNLEYDVLTKENENFQDYKIIIDKKETILINEITNMIKDSKKIYNEDQKELSVVFDNHLYQPLIINNNKIITVPTGLNHGEKKLVMDLRDFILKNKNNVNIKKLEFYLFRNLSKKGVGFFAETNNFYPDFILWVVNNEKQKIVFIDPKSLIHAPGDKIPKIEIKNTLKEIEARLNKTNFELTSFIVAGENSSFTKIKGLGNMRTKEDFEKNHVVFQEDVDYIEKIILSVID